jgi:AcrR family transcriptional regulator
MAFSGGKTTVAAAAAAPVAAGGGGADEVPGWQARALDRSLGDARDRSVERLSAFVAAARELAAETGSSAFTVQQVVERSGQSLKSFYRLFAGKDDLLLALLEEDSAVGAGLLTAMVDRHRSPVHRVRAWVDGMFALMAAGEPGYVGVLVREHRRLAEARPDQLAAALGPFVALLADELARAAEAGVARRREPVRDAWTVLDLVLLQIHHLMAPAAGAAAGADANGDDQGERARATAAYVWSFVWSGLAADERASR